MQPLAIIALFFRLAAFVGASASSSSPHSQEPAQDLNTLAKLMPKSTLPPPRGLRLNSSLRRRNSP
ncbi:hypothetical protein DDE82_008538 [Stemphylium lycopersici]|nr:hypothetical protein DDE82_008538 [Stemphylium lycopersici]